MNIFGITGQYLELLQMAEDESLDQHMINDTWKNYKDYRRSGDMRQYTKQMSALVEKYKGNSLLQQFAKNMAITYVPVINAMAEEKRNEQQTSEKEKK